MPHQPARVALVGLGKIARDQHLPALAASETLDLVATVSPSGSSAGFPAFRDLDSLLASGIAFDALSLCTPPGVRTAIARQALEAGLHVMLEKPPALTVAEALPLADLAREKGRALFATWHSRETTGVDAAADWLDGRTIEQVEVVWREDVQKWHPGQDWLLAEGGFGVFDPAINALSILTRILPERLTVTGAELFVPANRAAPAEAQITMFHGAAPVKLDLSILDSGQQHWDITIRTNDGTLFLTEGGNRMEVDGTLVASSEDREYPRLYARFAELVATGGIDLDLEPLRLVEDSMAIGRITALPPFHFL